MQNVDCFVSRRVLRSCLISPRVYYVAAGLIVLGEFVLMSFVYYYAFGWKVSLFLMWSLELAMFLRCSHPCFATALHHVLSCLCHY
jgi:hypothetical protein